MGVFGDDKHTSRSARYTYIPTITALESLQREGFEPFFACQARVRDPERREYTKHMLRLRRTGQITQIGAKKRGARSAPVAPLLHHPQWPDLRSRHQR
ncbi:hypothetical protein QS26_01880 [Salmonella enterica subsp. enterica serovar Havana]|nr:hypothetical protein SEEW9607_05608 [Salmonella enterica subsp. enterica serovar Worthington str. ATCC 9607]ESJ40097.1 hypothetical protein CFSAN001082_20091 [Salmonella enterica subsp. enterica serovar Havana str. CFSAN001082]KHP17876.1 hypothetical protein QS26_01880 [Salmonella enterica subsp. enterica serovar Havana]KNM15286.1 hypothetical protein AEU85_14240 [Salmonella enterica subsp. enterica serovar Worthington]SUF48966.1 prophage protein [Salmonella enterica]